MLSVSRRVLMTTAVLVAARILVVIAGVAAVALASRYLGVAEYGSLTAAMAFASSFAVLTDLGISTVAARQIVLRPQDERQVVGNVVTLGLALGAVAAVVAVAVTSLTYAGPDDRQTREAIFLLLTQLLAAPFSGAARAYFTAAQRAHVLAVGDVALALGMTALTAVAVAADTGFITIVGAVAAGYALQAAALVVAALRSRAMSVRLDPATWKTLARLALPLAGVMVINFLYFRLDVLLLSWIDSDREVGLYGLAYRVIEALIVLPGFLMLALFPEIARNEADRGALAALIGPALIIMQVFALPAVVLPAIFAQEIVVAIGGSAFEDAAPVLQLLILAIGVSYVNGVYGNALVALGFQKRLFKQSLVVLGVNLLLNLVLIPPFGASGAAVAVVVAELISYVLVRRYYTQVAGKPPEPPHVRILAAGVGLILALGCRIWLDGLPDVVLALVGSTLGLAAYGALLIHFEVIPKSVVARALSRRRSSEDARTP